MTPQEHAEEHDIQMPMLTDPKSKKKEPFIDWILVSIILAFTALVISMSIFAYSQGYQMGYIDGHLAGYVAGLHYSEGRNAN